MIRRYFIKFLKKLSQVNYIISKDLKILTYFAYFVFLFLFILDLVLFNIFLRNMTDWKFFCLFVITLILGYTIFTFKSILSDSTCKHCKFGYLVMIPRKFRKEILEKNKDFSMFICENCGKIQ
jgi:hypothetical protein